MISPGQHIRIEATRLVSKVAKPLERYQDYSREDVHAIFAPSTPFTPQTGSWGLHGIVSIPDRPGDFVFFVTLGQQQGDHVFDEGVTEDGVLSWQSQPRQELASPQIQQFIEHDELKNSIYLFLRARKRGKYTYLGKLKYLSHDAERENPVYFQWQISDWAPSEAAIERIGLSLQPPLEKGSVTVSPAKDRLQKTLPPPSNTNGVVKTTPTFRSRKTPDYSAIDAKNRELGLRGEKLVVEQEKRMLIEDGRPDLAEMVRHVSIIEGDGAGYDVESFTPEGDVKYIEVKTTRGPAQTPFYMSANEVEFSRSHPDNYYLYRVYAYDEEHNFGSFYVDAGKVENVFDLTPTQYRVVRS